MATCTIPDCDRPLFARELCRSHYARRGKRNARAPIRAKRPAGEVENISGLLLSLPTGRVIRRVARERGTSEHAVIIDVIENWAARHARADSR
jgi:hypothetical protein